MIGYYIHHHGRGHLNRAASIARKLNLDVTALTSADSVAVEAFDDHVQLQLDYGDAHELDPTANDALHWAPIHEAGLRLRMARVAEWVETARPDVVVVDVSVEIATFIRLMGSPGHCCGDARRQDRFHPSASVSTCGSHHRRLAARDLRPELAPPPCAQDDLCGRYQPVRGPGVRISDRRQFLVSASCGVERRRWVSGLER